MDEFNAEKYVSAKVKGINDPRLLTNFEKAVERKHRYGFMTDSIYHYTIKKIQERRKEILE